MFKKKHFILLISLVLAACAGAKSTPTPTLSQTLSTAASGTKQLPTPIVKTTHVPDPKTAAELYMKSWQESNYSQMYELLSSPSKQAITLDAFTKLYDESAIKLTLQKVEPSILFVSNSTDNAQAGFRVTLQTYLFKNLERENTMNLVMENGGWKITWDTALILPELKDGAQLSIDYNIPKRGSIYDREGRDIAVETEVVALGVIPGQIDPDQERKLITQLAMLTGISGDKIYEKYADAGADWYVPIGETSAKILSNYSYNAPNFSGLFMNPFATRYSYTVDSKYYTGGIAPQVTGYVSLIPSESNVDYRRKGYQGDELVGASGLEKWGEDHLAGTHGATLSLIDAQGQVASRLGASESKPAQDITLTLDSRLQARLQQSIGEYRGAIVVMESDSGRILAMVSSPGFNPNLFSADNYNHDLLNEVLSNPDQPLVNRAAQSGYPLGSVFKIITMAAALESQVYNAESSYYCGHEFTEIAGLTLYDWTKAKDYKPSGELTLPEGLIRSCNPWFYHIGLDLYRRGMTNAVSEMARGFGLGSSTGIEQIPEITGNIPDPQSEGDAVQLAIGQGAMLVSPLQVARFIAAIGNGGTLYRPQLVEKISDPDGTEVFSLKPEIDGTLPVSQENLEIIKTAMKGVAFSRTPRGTAYQALNYVKIPIAGKTSTAQTGNEHPHAWFAGFSNYKTQPKPNIAVAVILEDAGEGADLAAPLFRRAISMYFSDFTDFGGLMPWEEKPFEYSGIEPTPTASPTPSGTPEP